LPGITATAAKDRSALPIARVVLERTMRAWAIDLERELGVTGAGMGAAEEHSGFLAALDRFAELDDELTFEKWFDEERKLFE
jgi:hypothetical protein